MLQLYSATGAGPKAEGSRLALIMTVWPLDALIIDPLGRGGESNLQSPPPPEVAVAVLVFWPLDQWYLLSLNVKIVVLVTSLG